MAKSDLKKLQQQLQKAENAMNEWKEAHSKIAEKHNELKNELKIFKKILQNLKPLVKFIPDLIKGGVSEMNMLSNIVGLVTKVNFKEMFGNSNPSDWEGVLPLLEKYEIVDNQLLENVQKEVSKK